MWPGESTNRSRATQCGSEGSCLIHFWNSRYASGARLIAVPGWPLPTFCTASIASTRAVSMALRSRSPNPSGRVGVGCAGLPVGESDTASAGASDWLFWSAIVAGAPSVGRVCVGAMPECLPVVVLADLGPTRRARTINVT